MATLSEIREMSNEQMAAVLKEACQTLFRLRIQSQTERLEVPTELARNRKLVARIKTIQRERQIVGEKAMAAAKST
jgi:large subunit ribosomal protein L29